MATNVFRVMDKIYSPQIRLSVKLRSGMVRIEGSRKSLRWLSKVIGAYADQRFQDDFWIKPKGPGSVYFAKGTTHGIYLFNSDTLKKTSRPGSRISKAARKASHPHPNQRGSHSTGRSPLLPGSDSPR